MIDKKRLNIFLIGAGLSVSVGIFGAIFNPIYHNRMRLYIKQVQQTCAQKYIYDSYSTPPSEVLTLESLGDSSQYIAYYKLVHQGENPFITFSPLESLRKDHKHYIVGYTKDSVFAQVLSVNTGGDDYSKTWVFTTMLHDTVSNGIGK